jgi:hypothetical protein
MQYYKFIKDLKIYSKRGVIEFIENELKTETELKNILGSIFDKVILNKNIQKIDLQKNKVYFSFGVRKQITNNL